VATRKKKIRWRWVPGYEGLYRISSFGKVRSYKQDKTCGKILKQHYNKTDGYMQCILYGGNPHRVLSFSTTGTT
jgi:hypothetical protein